jgi:hypothetical protein
MKSNDGKLLRFNSLAAAINAAAAMNLRLVVIGGSLSFEVNDEPGGH